MFAAMFMVPVVGMPCTDGGVDCECETLVNEINSRRRDTMPMREISFPQSFQYEPLETEFAALSTGRLNLAAVAAVDSKALDYECICFRPMGSESILETEEPDCPAAGPDPRRARS